MENGRGKNRKTDAGKTRKTAQDARAVPTLWPSAFPAVSPFHHSSKMLTISPSRIRFMFFTAQKFPHMEQVSSFSGLADAR